MGLAYDDVKQHVLKKVKKRKRKIEKKKGKRWTWENECPKAWAYGVTDAGESQVKVSHGVYLKRTIMVNAGALLGVTFIEKAGGKQMLFSDLWKSWDWERDRESGCGWGWDATGRINAIFAPGDHSQPQGQSRQSVFGKRAFSLFLRELRATHFCD